METARKCKKHGHHKGETVEKGLPGWHGVVNNMALFGFTGRVSDLAAQR